MHQYAALARREIANCSELAVRCDHASGPIVNQKSFIIYQIRLSIPTHIHSTTI
jgi:hypothetical protein